VERSSQFITPGHMPSGAARWQMAQRLQRRQRWQRLHGQRATRRRQLYAVEEAVALEDGAHRPPCMGCIA
jgi:hypothetical protein